MEIENIILDIFSLAVLQGQSTVICDLVIYNKTFTEYMIRNLNYNSKLSECNFNTLLIFKSMASNMDTFQEIMANVVIAPWLKYDCDEVRSDLLSDGLISINIEKDVLKGNRHSVLECTSNCLISYGTHYHIEKYFTLSQLIIASCYSNNGISLFSISNHMFMDVNNENKLLPMVYERSINPAIITILGIPRLQDLCAFKIFRLAGIKPFEGISRMLPQYNLYKFGLLHVNGSNHTFTDHKLDVFAMSLSPSSLFDKRGLSIVFADILIYSFGSCPLRYLRVNLFRSEYDHCFEFLQALPRRDHKVGMYAKFLKYDPNLVSSVLITHNFEIMSVVEALVLGGVKYKTIDIKGHVTSIDTDKTSQNPLHWLYDKIGGVLPFMHNSRIDPTEVQTMYRKHKDLVILNSTYGLKRRAYFGVHLYQRKWKIDRMVLVMYFDGNRTRQEEYTLSEIEKIFHIEEIGYSNHSTIYLTKESNVDIRSWVALIPAGYFTMVPLYHAWIYKVVHRMKSIIADQRTNKTTQAIILQGIRYLLSVPDLLEINIIESDFITGEDENNYILGSKASHEYALKIFSDLVSFCMFSSKMVNFYSGPSSIGMKLQRRNAPACNWTCEMGNIPGDFNEFESMYVESYMTFQEGVSQRYIDYIVDCEFNKTKMYLGEIYCNVEHVPSLEPDDDNNDDDSFKLYDNDYSDLELE